MSATKWTSFFHETAHRSTAATVTNKSASTTFTKTIYSTYWHFWNHIAHPVTLKYPHRIQKKSLHYRFQSDKDKSNNRQDAVYKAKYIDCHTFHTEESDKNLINKRMTERKQATTVKSENTLVNIFNWRTLLPTWTLRKVSLQRYLVSTTDSRKMVHSLSTDSGLEQTPLKRC